MRKSVGFLICSVVCTTAGIGIGRFTKPSGTETAASFAQVAAKRDARDRKAVVRSDVAAAGVEDLLKMVRTGRSGLGIAKVTMSLQDLPPARLAELAGEMRDLQRRKPDYDWNQMRLLDAVLSAWADADPRAALDFVKTSASRSFRTNALGSVFGVLGESDPEDAIACASELNEPGERQNALGAVSWSLAQRDPQRAMDLFGKMKELPERSKVAIIGELAKQEPLKAAEAMAKVSPIERERFWNSDGIFTTWAANDPEAVLGWAQKTTDLDLRNSAMTAACRRLAVDDPSAALTRVDSLPSHLRKELVSAIIGTWADSDLKGALAAAGALSQPAEKEQAMGSIVDRLDWLNPSVSSEVVLAMPKGNARGSALQQLAWGLGYQSGPEKMELLEKFQGVEKSKLASMIACSMISEDADAAMKLFASVPSTQRDDYAFRRFTWSLSADDPEKALAFSSQLDSSAERGQMVNQAMQQLAKLSPSAAAARLESIKDSNDRQQALTAIAETWGAADAPAALAWAASLPGEERAAALASLLPQQAVNDPRGAGAQLQELIANPAGAPGSVLQSATGQLAREWAGRNPEEAATWIEGLPPGNAAEAGAGALVTSWSDRDPSAAAEWLSSLPSGGVKDAAIEPLVASIRQSDPDSAFSWGLSMTDATKRAAIMEETIKGWDRSDPAAVRQALRNAQIDADERQSYEKLLK